MAKQMKAAVFMIAMDDKGKYEVRPHFNGPYEAVNSDTCKFMKECATILQKQLNDQPGTWPTLILPNGQHNRWFQ